MQLQLIEKEHLNDNVWAFRFKPSEPLDYDAGQYIRVQLLHDAPDQEGTKRWFTNSAAPYENIVQITTRVTNSTFKQALSKLEPGDALQLIGMPEGDFTWQDSDLPKVFIAGGIGVTPFRSILKQRAHDDLPLEATLIYGGRSKDTLPFKEEMGEWQMKDANFKVIYSIGEPFTHDTIAATYPEINSALVYVSGPEPMVQALSDDLVSHGLPPAQLKRDDFPNYDQTSY